jgi:crotonobetainyl-CoA:carnitine CoA-transferase CaiB-like acyl-CoA transferase
MLPLEGIRVVDVTTSVAGPFATLVLGALGAEVIKVERRDGGDDARTWGPPFWNGESAMFLAMNASKRSVALDFKSDEDMATMRRLVAGADAFVQNLRPGTADKLGLGFEQLREVNDRLIYCTIGAFGSVGPKSAEPGYDPLMQAAGGIMSITGEPDGPPVRAGASIVDQGTGMWAAIAILSALRKRDQGAGAQLLETSLFETAVNWLPYQVVGYLASGRVPGPQGSGIGMIAPYEAFETTTGRVMIAAANDRLFARMCEALELPEAAADPRYATNPDRVTNREALRATVAAAVHARTREDVLERLNRAGVPAAPVQDIADVVADPQLEALGLLQELPHPQIPDLRLVGLPLWFDGERLPHRSPPPQHGEYEPEG